MQFVPAAEIVRAGYAGGYAVPSFCVWDSVTMDAVLRVASQCRAPVILMCGSYEFRLMVPGAFAAVARAVAARHDVPAALHLDHGDSLGAVDACLEAGFTSVMLDYSGRPLGENVAAVREVVRRARPRRVSVEGEVGVVGRAGADVAEGGGTSVRTDPDEARAFVEQTGVDMLAVSIGNAHGLYRQPPEFDFALLERLRPAAGVPLVLHGGTGTPDEDLRNAISLGIAKVNVASELVQAVRQSLLTQWQGGRSEWVPGALMHAMSAYAAVVEKWFSMTGSAGKA